MAQITVVVPYWAGEAEMPVTFLRLNWDPVSEEIRKKCARLYCQIWKEPPWNESFWEEAGVLADMQRELEKPCAEGFIAVYLRALYRYEYENCRTVSDETLMMVAGFTWGYPVSQEELREIAGNNALDPLFCEHSRVFYVDELGVNSEHRGRGIGKRLSHLLLKAAKTHGIKLAVLRTDDQAVAARRLYSSLGFSELTARDERYPERTYWVLAL